METGQTTFVQGTAVPLTQARQTGKLAGAENAAAGQALGLDGFSAIFALLAQAMQQGGQTAQTVDAAALQNSGTGQSVETDAAKGKSNALAEQMAAALLAAYPQFAAFLQADSKTAQQMVATLKLPAGAAQMLLNLRQSIVTELQGNGAVHNDQSPAAAIQTFSQAGSVAATATPQAATQSADTDVPTAAKATGATGATGAEASAAVTAKETDGTVLQAVNQFTQNVRAAKKLMDGGEQRPRLTKDAAESTVDVDALQSHAQASRAAISTAVLKAATQPQSQPADLTAQLERGVAENLLKGSRQFTMKLKPEGLGEITVQLTEKAGEAATLHLLTANADTARLINGNLDSLKEAMRPLQVVVESAQSQQAENSAGQTGQQAAAFSQQFNRRHAPSYGLRASAELEDAQEEELPAGADLVRDITLDSYI